MKKRIIVINYDVKEGKISQINVHYNGQNASINDDNINLKYIGLDHKYDNLCMLCSDYSIRYSTPIEYVTLDSDPQNTYEIEKELLEMLKEEI